MDYAQRKTQLAAMEAALRVTRRERRTIHEDMVREAERRAQARHPEWRRPSRVSTRWNGVDQRNFNDHLVDLHFARARELGALDRKAARQAAAIADLRRAWGVNEPEERAA